MPSYDITADGGLIGAPASVRKQVEEMGLSPGDHRGQDPSRTADLRAQANADAKDAGEPQPFRRKH